MIPPVVDVQWLAAHPEARIVDVRWYLDGRSGRDAWCAGHLPGASFVDLDAVLAEIVGTIDAGERQTLLLAAREDARRPVGQIDQAESFEGRAGGRAAASVAESGQGQGMDEVTARGAAQHHGTLEDHGMAAADCRGAGTQPFHRTGRRSYQPVAETEGQALAGTVRSENDRYPMSAESQGQRWNQRRFADGVTNAAQAQRQARGIVTHRTFRRLQAASVRCLQNHA